MLYMTREDRLILMEGMSNTRDLGGYETQSGQYSQAHRYIRAASPARATKQDIQTLKAYGIKAVIDLRSDFEKEKQVSPLKKDNNFDYYEVNLFDSTDASVVPAEVKIYKDLGGVYIYMLESMKHKFKELFEIFAKYTNEGVMFHCSAGKDRTGVTATLLLDLIGCHEYDIVKDYSESYENNININQQLTKMMDDDTVAYLKSTPRYIMEFLEYLREHYGSAKEYLLECGVSINDIDQIIENFII